MPRASLDLFLFTTDAVQARVAVESGVTGVIVDWEYRGKTRRQAGADTEINTHTPEDLARVRAATRGRVLCRIDGSGPRTQAQVDLAVALGADEILLPMVRRPDDVDHALDALAGRAGLGILVETQDAVECAPALARRPLTRVYLGLNDLRIDRGRTTLFEPLVDGTAEFVRRVFDVPFGVAGLTRVGAGAPVASRLLAAELARLDAQFTFLRRSFCRDVPVADMPAAVPEMLAEVALMRLRRPDRVAADHAALHAALGLVPQVA